MYRTALALLMSLLLCLPTAQADVARGADCENITALSINDYRLNTPQLSRAAKFTLTELAQDANKADCILTVVGYSSFDGNTETNQRLSAVRAETVRGFLMKQGLPATHIHLINVGETDQFGALAANRRVVVRPTPKAGRRCSKNPLLIEPLPSVSVTDYASGNLALSDIARKALAASAAIYADENCSIRVEGFASPDGHARLNRERAGKRAQQVADHLHTLGVHKGLLQVIAFGETDQFGPDLSANRRVVVSMN